MDDSSRKDEREVESKSFQELLEEEDEPQVSSEEDNALQELVDRSDSLLAEALDTTMTTLAPTPIERQILEGSLKGFTISQIALKLCIPESHIRTYLRQSKVREYIQDVRETVNELDQMMLADTLRKVVGARVDQAINEEGEVDYAILSKKDTLDVIKVFADMTNNISKNKKEEKSENVFVNIYNQIID